MRRRASGSPSARLISSAVTWPLCTGSSGAMPPMTSPSASACTSSSCNPQKSAICLNERAVFSIIQSAVALGIIGWDMDSLLRKRRLHPPFRAAGPGMEFGCRDGGRYRGGEGGRPGKGTVWDGSRGVLNKTGTNLIFKGMHLEPAEFDDECPDGPGRSC